MTGHPPTFPNLPDDLTASNHNPEGFSDPTETNLHFRSGADSIQQATTPQTLECPLIDLSRSGNDFQAFTFYPSSLLFQEASVSDDIPMSCRPFPSSLQTESSSYPPRTTAQRREAIARLVAIIGEALDIANSDDI
jgi:hypothetical protein